MEEYSRFCGWMQYPPRFDGKITNAIPVSDRRFWHGIKIGQSESRHRAPPSPRTSRHAHAPPAPPRSDGRRAHFTVALEFVFEDHARHADRLKKGSVASALRIPCRVKIADKRRQFIFLSGVVVVI